MNQSSRRETWEATQELGGRRTPSSTVTWINPSNRPGSLKPAPKEREPGEKCDGQRPRSEKVPAVPRLESGRGRHHGPRNPSGSPLRGRGSGSRQGGRQAGKPSREPDYGRSSRSGRKADSFRHRRPDRDWCSSCSLPRSLYPPNGNTSKPARSVPTSEGLQFARNVSSKLRRYCLHHFTGVKGEFAGRAIRKVVELAVSVGEGGGAPEGLAQPRAVGSPPWKRRSSSGPTRRRT